MSNYELRLLNHNGGVILIYQTCCENDSQAWQKVIDITDVPYATFEISREWELIGGGNAASARSRLT